jgi:hypothetical protein
MGEQSKLWKITSRVHEENNQYTFLGREDLCDMGTASPKTAGQAQREG